MTQTIEELKQDPNVGRSLASTGLTNLLQDFDARRLLLRVGGSGDQRALYLEIPFSIATGLDRLKAERILPIAFLEQVPTYRFLEQQGIVRINNLNSQGVPIDDYAVFQGRNYPTTEVVGVQKPALFGKTKYFPVRR